MKGLWEVGLGEYGIDNGIRIAATGIQLLNMVIGG